MDRRIPRALKELVFERGYWLVSGPEIEREIAFRWISDFESETHARETDKLVRELEKWRYVAIPISTGATQVPAPASLSHVMNNPRLETPCATAEQFVQEYVMKYGYRTNSEKRLIKWLEQQPKTLFRLPDGLGSNAAYEQEVQIAEQINSVLNMFSVQGKTATVKAYAPRRYYVEALRVNALRVQVKKPVAFDLLLPGLYLKVHGETGYSGRLSIGFDLHSNYQVLVLNPKLDKLGVMVFDPKAKLLLSMTAEPVVSAANEKLL